MSQGDCGDRCVPLLLIGKPDESLRTFELLSYSKSEKRVGQHHYATDEKYMWKHIANNDRPFVFLFIILWPTKIRPKYSMTLLAECDDDLRIIIRTNWITKEKKSPVTQTNTVEYILKLMVVFFCATRSKWCDDLSEENTK